LLERWVRLFDRVENGEMPPDAETMSADDRTELLKSLEAPLRAACEAATARNGRGAIRRLTRAEFENNLRVLLKLPHLDVRDKVPEDRDAHGFTKVASLLDMSRVQLDGYLAAAEAALRTAMAAPAPPPLIEQRFTGTDLFPELETFGEREAMFFARNNRMVSITNQQFAAMTSA